MRKIVTTRPDRFPDEFLTIKPGEGAPQGKYLAIDTETTGLDPHTDSVVTLAVHDGHTTYLYDGDWPDLSGHVLIAHNAMFDYKMMLGEGVLYDCPWACTMLGEKILHSADPMQHYSLNGLLEKYFGKTIEDKDSIRMSFKYVKEKFSSEQVNYACEDVEFLYPLFFRLKDELRKFRLLRAWFLENHAIKPAAELEFYGLPVNWKEWNQVTHKLRQEKKQLEDNLAAYLWEHYPKECREEVQERAKGTGLLFGQEEYESTVPIKMTSSKQRLRFFSKLGMKLRDKHNKETTSKEVLKKEAHPVADRYLDIAEMNSHITKFGEKWASANPVTGRVHTRFNLIVSTGRTSSSNPNIQQIPSKKSVRDCFQAPKGFVMVGCDYPSQEPRITADKTKDRELIRFFNEGLHGGDMHGFVAQKVHGVEIPPKIDGDQEALDKFYASPHKHLRQETKKVNLGLDYGLTAFSIAWDMGWKKEKAQEVINSILDAFPGKKRYFKWRLYDLYKKGYILTNPVTKRKYFPYRWEEHLELKIKVDNKLASDAEVSEFFTAHNSFRNKSLNFPTQSTAADMTKTAMILVRKELIRNGIMPGKDCPVQLVNMVHDELLYCVREDLAEWFKPILEQAMNKAAKVFLKRVRMEAHAYISPVWEK